MKKICKYFFETVVILLFSGGLLWLLGPYEDADLSADFDATKLDVGVGDILPPSPNPSMVQGILDWGKEL